MKNLTAAASTLILFLLLMPAVTLAQSWPEEDPRSFYATVLDVMPQSGVLPTVVNVSLPYSFNRATFGNQVLVYEPLTATYLDSELSYSTRSEPLLFQMYEGDSSDGLTGAIRNLLDRNPQTTVDLRVAGASTEAYTNFFIQADSSLTLSQVMIDYAPNSPLPTEVTIFAQNEFGVEELVLRSSGFDRGRLVFPPRFSRNWRIAFMYDAPVRVSEITLGPEIVTSVLDGVRFLAQPNQPYEIYLDPETVPYVLLRSSGNLNVPEAEVTQAAVGMLRNNPLAVALDSDNDGIPDTADNCPYEINPDQVSTRGAGYGDACDDFDYDGHINTEDNCELIPNPAQRDQDGDGLGDECDASESRLTEQYPWLPWVGIVITLIVIGTLFVTVARHPVVRPKERVEEEV